MTNTKNPQSTIGKGDTRTGNKPLRTYSLIHAIQEQPNAAHLQVEGVNEWVFPWRLAWPLCFALRQHSNIQLNGHPQRSKVLTGAAFVIIDAAVCQGQAKDGHDRVDVIAKHDIKVNCKLGLHGMCWISSETCRFFSVLVGSRSHRHTEPRHLGSHRE